MKNNEGAVTETSEIFRNLQDCASCQGDVFEQIYDFGLVPLAGYFPFAGKEDRKNLVPMSLWRCLKCGLVQIDPIVHDDYLFTDYRYRSKYSMKSHFTNLSKWIVERGFNSKNLVLEIGSNDGTLIEELRLRGIEVVGVDPASNIVEHSRKLGHNVLGENFSLKLVHSQGLASKVDLVISCNSFAHIENIREVTKAINEALKVGGYFLVEVQSWEELVNQGSFDFVYHEHKYYYDLASLKYLLAQEGLELVEAEKVESHGGSWRCLFAKRALGTYDVRDLVKSQNMISKEFIQERITFFFHSLGVIRSKVLEIQKNGESVVGFGASGRANMLLAYMHLPSFFKSIFDESPERIGRNMGFTGIRIQSISELSNDEYTYCLVLAWNFFDEICKKWPHADKNLLRPLPQYALVKT